MDQITPEINVTDPNLNTVGGNNWADSASAQEPPAQLANQPQQIDPNTPAHHNVWLDYLKNLAGAAMGGGAGGSAAPQGHNMSSQGNPAPNPTGQSIAAGAAKTGLASCCGG